MIYNASYRTRGPFAELDPAEVEKSIAVTAFGAFLVAQQAVKRMLPNGRGVDPVHRRVGGREGLCRSRRRSRWASSRCAVWRRAWRASFIRRASMSAHVVIDGGIKSARRAEPPDKPDSLLDPDAIAASYLHVIHQPRSAWATEIELRPWVERF